MSDANKAWNKLKSAIDVEFYIGKKAVADVDALFEKPVVKKEAKSIKPGK